jgi:hypothetical protein
LLIRISNPAERYTPGLLPTSAGKGILLDVEENVQERTRFEKIHSVAEIPGVTPEHPVRLKKLNSEMLSSTQWFHSFGRNPP